MPSGPAATTTRRPSIASSSRSPIQDGSRENVEDADQPSEETKAEESQVERPTSSIRVPEKFFVVKSLTLQDLEQSVGNGIWATQAHNEEALNKAYAVCGLISLQNHELVLTILQTADNVYLIFSANKSGEYFGYARMISPISTDAVEFKRLTQEAKSSDSEAPRKIPTPATEFAPKGHIIDDSARGTIFWEADLSDLEDEEDDKPRTNSDAEGAEDKPFRVEWISTNRLPFYRTRGLRNPWNANREVKIARDGTELETSVGKRLVQMFHRPITAAGPAGIASSSVPRAGYPSEMGGPLPPQMGFQ
jgi:hypothetical protein